MGGGGLVTIVSKVNDGETATNLQSRFWNRIHFQMNRNTYFDGYLSLLSQLKKQKIRYYLHNSMDKNNAKHFKNRFTADLSTIK